ncbi:MAG: hypothetical protein R3Y40_09165 [Eubacteriales bacterium]
MTEMKKNEQLSTVQLLTIEADELNLIFKDRSNPVHLNPKSHDQLYEKIVNKIIAYEKAKDYIAEVESETFAFSNMSIPNLLLYRKAKAYVEKVASPLLI